jgi:hypothetical protein
VAFGLAPTKAWEPKSTNHAMDFDYSSIWVFAGNGSSYQMACSDDFLEIGVILKNANGNIHIIFPQQFIDIGHGLLLPKCSL